MLASPGLSYLVRDELDLPRGEPVAPMAWDAATAARVHVSFRARRKGEGSAVDSSRYGPTCGPYWSCVASTVPPEADLLVVKPAPHIRVAYAPGKHRDQRRTGKPTRMKLHPARPRLPRLPARDATTWLAPGGDLFLYSASTACCCQLLASSSIRCNKPTHMPLPT